MKSAVAVVYVVNVEVPVCEELAYTRQPKQQAPAQGCDVIGTNHSIGLTKSSTLDSWGRFDEKSACRLEGLLKCMFAFGKAKK